MSRTWNALVVYVDESGEHGLLMSPTALRDGSLILKYAAKNAGMSVEDFIAAMPMPIMARGEKDSKISKVMKEMMSQNLNGTNGVENCKNIADYCESNGLPMEAYFPEMSWAASLGEGWFIPGTDELEIYANVIAQGVGKANSAFEKNPENKGKIAKVNGLSIAGNINYIYFGLAYFQNQFFQSWYVFNKKGIDYQQYTNAFKWF